MVDLVEEDFTPRVQSLLKETTNLESLTLCIPSMARLHPSNSLPKALDVLNGAAKLRPSCCLGLIVHEAEHAWSALTILNGIVELKLQLYSLEFSRAFFQVEVLIEAAKSCGLVSLTISATQVFSSSPELTTASPVSIPTLMSLVVNAGSESSPGLNNLLKTAASTLTHLELSSNASSGVENPLTLHGIDFPNLVDETSSEGSSASSRDFVSPASELNTSPAPALATVQE